MSRSSNIPYLFTTFFLYLLCLPHVLSAFALLISLEHDPNRGGSFLFCRQPIVILTPLFLPYQKALLTVHALKILYKFTIWPLECIMITSQIALHKYSNHTEKKTRQDIKKMQ